MKLVRTRAERLHQRIEPSVRLSRILAPPLVPASHHSANQTPRTRRPLAVGIVERVDAPRSGVKAPERKGLLEHDPHGSLTFFCVVSAVCIAFRVCLLILLLFLLAGPVQFFPRPEDIGYPWILEARLGDRAPDVDVKRDFLTCVVGEPGALEVATRSETERRLAQSLNLPERQRDQELLLLLRKPQSRVAVRPPERADKSRIQNERGANLARCRIVHGKDRLT